MAARDREEQVQRLEDDMVAAGYRFEINPRSRQQFVGDLGAEEPTAEEQRIEEAYWAAMEEETPPPPPPQITVAESQNAVAHARQLLAQAQAELAAAEAAAAQAEQQQQNRLNNLVVALNDAGAQNSALRAQQSAVCRYYIQQVGINLERTVELELIFSWLEQNTIYDRNEEEEIASLENIARFEDIADTYEIRGALNQYFQARLRQRRYLAPHNEVDAASHPPEGMREVLTRTFLERVDRHVMDRLFVYASHVPEVLNYYRHNDPTSPITMDRNFVATLVEQALRNGPENYLITSLTRQFGLGRVDRFILDWTNAIQAGLIEGVQNEIQNAHIPEIVQFRLDFLQLPEDQQTLENRRAALQNFIRTRAIPTAQRLMVNPVYVVREAKRQSRQMDGALQYGN